MYKITYALIILLALCVGCGKSAGSDQVSPSGNDQITDAADRSETVANRNETQVPKDAHASTRTFRGHTCKDDCAGHEAGYRWAFENGIGDPDKCRGKSASFVEGCRIGAEELLAQVFANLEKDIDERATKGRNLVESVCAERNCNSVLSGYEWAKQNQVVAGSDCDIFPGPFSEGCFRYLSEQL